MLWLLDNGSTATFETASKSKTTFDNVSKTTVDSIEKKKVTVQTITSDEDSTDTEYDSDTGLTSNIKLMLCQSQ